MPLTLNPGDVFTAAYANSLCTFAGNETITGQWTLSRNSEHLYFVDANGTTNQKRFLLEADSGHFYIHAYTDAPAWDKTILQLKHTNGDVGLGISPSYRLDVSGSCRISNNLAVGTTPTVYPFEVNNAKNADYVAAFKNTGTAGWGIRIQANSDTNPSLRVVAADGASTNINLYGNGNADFAGKVGIGVVAGSYPLTLKGSGDHLSWQNSSGTEVGRLGIQDSGAAGWISLYSSSVAKIIIHGNGQYESAIATGTAPLIVASTTVCTNLNADMVDGLHTTVIAIGDWDMDTTQQVTVAHGLTLSKIRSISAIVYADTGIGIYDFNGFNGEGNAVYADGTSVALDRLTGGYFDNTGFNQTSFNRGWITIQHIP